MISSTTPRSLRLGSCLLLAACTSLASTDVSDEVDEKIRHGEYRAALVEATENLKQMLGDEEARVLHEKARVAAMLDKGRTLSFQDRDDEALEIFRMVRDEFPGSDQATQWVKKTEHKLGMKWINIGLEHHAGDDLEGAIAAYDKALTYLPADQSATVGLAAARFLSEYRVGVGDEYYVSGVRALSDYYLQQARTAFEKGLKYKERDELSTERREQVKVLLSEQRVVLAGDLEGMGLFGAARHEYKMALQLDPKNEAAAAGAERAAKEAKAQDLLTAAEMQTLRGRFDKAREILAEGAALTKVQGERFEGAVAGIDDAIHENMYQEAIDQYRDGDYEAAVKRFDELLAYSQYYKDARTRRDSLQSDIDAASERYERAAKAENDEERLRLLREIEVFWSNYRDIQLQIQRLDTLQ